jgi:hypothetical protein
LEAFMNGAATVRLAEETVRRRPSVIWLGPIICLAALGIVSFRAFARRASSAEARGPALAAAVVEGQGVKAPRSAPRFAPAASVEAAPAPSEESAQPASWRTYLAKLKAEGTDAQWSAPTEAGIRKVVAELALPGMTLVSAHCGQTVCEAVFDHATHDQQMQAPWSLNKGPFATGVHYRYDGLRTYAYLQREKKGQP